MKANELVNLFQHFKHYDDKEVFVYVKNGLYYPIKDVKICAGHITIVCENIIIDAKGTDFEPAIFTTSVKTDKK